MSGSGPNRGFLNTLIDAFTMTADTTSNAQSLQQVNRYAIQASWSGTPVGNIIVYGSLDDITYTTIVTQAAGGAAGSWLLNVDNPAYDFIKVAYDNTSSTGVLTVKISGKLE